MANNTAANAATPLIDIDGNSLRDQASDFVTDSHLWVREHWFDIMVAAGIAVVIVVGLHAVRRIALGMCRRGDGAGGWGSIIGRALARTGNFFILMTALRLVVGYASAPDVIARTVAFLFTVAAVFQSALWVRELILGVVESRTQNEHYHSETLGSALGIIRLLTTIVLFAIAVVVVLSNVGVNVTGLVAGLGIGGIAIGLAAQGIFADLFAALSIIFDRPFRKGDNVSYDTTSGTIEEIGLKSTRIRAFTGEERVISNKNLLDKEILNNTQRVHRRAKFAIGVIYQTPPEVCARIPGILKEVVEANERSFVRAGFIGFGASSLDFEVEFDSAGPDWASFYDGRTAVGIAILRRFNEEGIAIAYPTQTTFTAAPDGKMVLPYAQVQPVVGVEGTHMVRDGDKPPE